MWEGNMNRNQKRFSILLVEDEYIDHLIEFLIKNKIVLINDNKIVNDPRSHNAFIWKQLLYKQYVNISEDTLLDIHVAEDLVSGWSYILKKKEALDIGVFDCRLPYDSTGNQTENQTNIDPSIPPQLIPKRNKEEIKSAGLWLNCLLWHVNNSAIAIAYSSYLSDPDFYQTYGMFNRFKDNTQSMGRLLPQLVDRNEVELCILVALFNKQRSILLDQYSIVCELLMRLKNITDETSTAEKVDKFNAFLKERVIKEWVVKYFFVFRKSLTDSKVFAFSTSKDLENIFCRFWINNLSSSITNTVFRMEFPISILCFLFVSVPQI